VPAVWWADAPDRVHYRGHLVRLVRLNGLSVIRPV
jgi:hypothetical protein